MKETFYSSLALLGASADGHVYCPLRMASLCSPARRARPDSAHCAMYRDTASPSLARYDQCRQHSPDFGNCNLMFIIGHIVCHLGSPNGFVS